MAAEKEKIGNQPLSNPAHEHFVTAYLGSWNQTAAYMEAYPDSSRESAGTSAHQLLKNPAVKARCNWLAAQFLGESQQVANLRIRSELEGIAFSRPTDYLTEDGGFDINRLKKDSPGWVRRIRMKAEKNGKGDFTRVFDVEIECIDRIRGIEVLGKITGLTEKPDDLTEETAAGLEAYGRAALERLRAKRTDK
jgi:hypothetical protein